VFDSIERSTKQIVITTIKTLRKAPPTEVPPFDKRPLKSNAANVGASDGGALKTWIFERDVIPSGIPIIVVEIIPIRIEPLTPLAINIPVIVIPIIVSRVPAFVKFPNATRVA